MQPKWMGPYGIVSSLGKGLYRIRNCSTDMVLKMAVHSLRLKQYFTSDPLRLKQYFTSDPFASCVS